MGMHFICHYVIIIRIDLNYELLPKTKYKLEDRKMYEYDIEAN